MLLALKERFYVTKFDEKVVKANERNEVVHRKFCHMERILVTLITFWWTDFPFCELFPCATPTAYIAVEVLTLSYAQYWMPKTLMSGQGAHLQIETLNHFAVQLNFHLTFTSGYSPWINETVERLYKDTLQVFRALLMEYEAELLPVVQANLNHTRVQSLAGRVPIEVFTALPTSSALDAIVVSTTTARNPHAVNLEVIGDFVQQMRPSLHTIHEEVLDVKERQRTRDIVAHNRTPANVDIGDFVLWS
ncbi:LOW QUALITY PROTEIN: hypothetical protein PHMEG_00024576 [Phytophthora megakarya]|uniref:Integrase catalytic domain-containing protein n=1 Tax=Phytophthora megakarya TaxID=4795 RepID=A0A225VDS8_9STRA|nr:LOW QUALITY PROTEIN: hypothetical protein PHMEG_00024576 [Phytophthora megakarya]